MSTAARRGREKERRRNEIIDAAETLFFSRGYEHVTIEDIATAAELARGTLYLYFKNKDDIYLAVATRGAYVLNQMLRSSSSGTATGFEKVKRYLSAFNQFHQDYPGYYLALWSSNMPRYEETDLSAMEEMIRIRSDNFRVIKEAIAEGLQDESIRNDIDPDLVTLFWMAAYQSVISVSPAVEMHMHVHNVEHTKLIEYAIEIVLRSLENR